MKFKNIIISFVSALITVFIIGGSYFIYAESGEKNYYTFTNPHSSFILVQAQYHGAMNEYFNDKLAMLVNLTDSNENFYDDVYFNPPVGVDSSNYSNKCMPENVSTYCVSMGAMDLYLAYVDTLNKMKTYLPMENLPANPTAENVLGQKNTRDVKIEKEYLQAKIAMESTVSAYNEFRLAYPLHKKYVSVINALVTYKLALKKIHNQVIKFPLKFIDATTW